MVTEIEYAGIRPLSFSEARRDGQPWAPAAGPVPTAVTVVFCPSQNGARTGGCADDQTAPAGAYREFVGSQSR